MNSDFHDEIMRRREERRRKRSNTWLNLIIRIIALVFVIVIIRYFGTVRVEQLKKKTRNSIVDSTQIFFSDKNTEN
jgi:predicted nucleic acid-binding Zn ribbon protein